jgi:hypothetical protein
MWLGVGVAMDLQVGQSIEAVELLSIDDVWGNLMFPANFTYFNRRSRSSFAYYAHFIDRDYA